jgi:protein Mpv17
MFGAVSVRLRLLNGSYLCGRIPLVNVFIFTIQLLGIGYVSLNFELHFSAKPILTTMITNSILNGIADTVAQTVSAARRRTAGRRAKKGAVSIDITELNEKNLPTHRGELYPASPFNAERLVRYMAWGFLMAPVQLQWFAYLSETFPITSTNQTSAVMWRVLLDQIVFSPIGLALFFIFMTMTEGGGKQAVMKKFNTIFISALKSNYVVWPIVQILNFRIVPLQFQLPFASTVGICWTTYLSLKNEAAEAAA